MRYSRQREALLDLLCSTTSHPDAQWLYNNLRKEYPNISLGTVYRNLRLLADEGAVLELNYDNTSHFDSDIKPHYHMQCTMCKRIIDIPKEDVSVNVKTESGIEIDGFNLALRGICLDCKINRNFL